MEISENRQEGQHCYEFPLQRSTQPQGQDTRKMLMVSTTEMSSDRKKSKAAASSSIQSAVIVEEGGRADSTVDLTADAGDTLQVVLTQENASDILITPDAERTVPLVDEVDDRVDVFRNEEKRNLIAVQEQKVTSEIREAV